MATAQYDLWPPAFTAVAEPNIPIDILQEQADLLGQKTNGLVLAEVRTGKAYNSNMIVVRGEQVDLPLLHTFYLVAPALGNYRYQLFRVEQPLEFYPLLIKGTPTGDFVEIGSKEHFVEALRQIFADPKTQKVVQSLIAQSQS
jgi:hypothetical protein